VDHPSDKATVEWIVTAPNHYQVVGNGRIVEVTDLPGALRTTHWQSTAPLATKVMVIGAARFAIQHVDEVAGIPVQSWVYPQDRDPGFYDYARAERILQFFTSHIGPYPYAKLANVQSKTRFGGMENASNIFYSENAISGTRQNEGLLAHEIAHQWFGDSVTEADWHHIWLSEGFASYFAELYLENAYGRDRLDAGMQQARSAVLEYYKQAPDSPIVDERITNLMQHLSANSYQKGSWVLHMLRFVVGDEAFWDGIQAYYRTYRDGNALTEDFETVMEAAADQELDWFFDQWIYQPGQPKYEGTWHFDTGTNELTVTLNQVQRGGASFSMPVELAIYPPGGGLPRIEVLQVDEQANTFAIALDVAPASVDLDPNTWLLMEADFVEKP
jgi:aminopeptidase N